MEEQKGSHFKLKDTKLDRNDEAWALKSDQLGNQKVKMRLMTNYKKPMTIYVILKN